MSKRIASVALVSIALAITACKQTEYVHVGPNWAAINELEPSGETFELDASGETAYRLGQDMRFSVQSARAGRLWIVQVGPDDELTQLYPNDYSEDNLVSADRAFSIPAPGADWSLEAVEPLGKSIVAFVVTTGEVDVDEILGQNSLSKGLRLVSDSGPWAIDHLVIDVSKE